MKPESNVTKGSQFRFTADTLAVMDALKVKLGLATRAAVIRFAVTRLAEAELPPAKPARKKTLENPGK